MLPQPLDELEHRHPIKFGIDDDDVEAGVRAELFRFFCAGAGRGVESTTTGRSGDRLACDAVPVDDQRVEHADRVSGLRDVLGREWDSLIGIVR